MLFAITSSWAIQGRIGYRVRSFGSETVGEIRKDEVPIRFWFVAGGCIAASATGVFFSGVGLSKVQRDEKKSA
ncbi:hypothetical protein [Horticoccus sp. 23ND18S-11]|uniref:hypothetical protein n=1 Tax=Horticoccus sp. 23ND18S-11 TaxID=3391832 RepID=UPI0039C99D83